MKYKVKIAEVNKSINLMHHSYIDLGLFAVNATTHTFLYSAVKTDWGADINDTELEFELNGKRCKYVGFKELYTQLYGNSFVTWEADSNTPDRRRSCKTNCKRISRNCCKLLNI